MTIEDKEKLKKFFEDPDWVLVEKLINEFIEPLKNVMSIDPNDTAENIKAEVRSRQRSYAQMSAFLREAGILKGQKEKSPTQFR